MSAAAAALWVAAPPPPFVLFDGGPSSQHPTSWLACSFLFAGGTPARSSPYLALVL